MISQETLDVLGDIFTERPDKITVTLDPVSRDITVVYEDLDEEWFKELQEAVRT